MGSGEGARLRPPALRPHFYHDLRRQGLLLSDFLDQQLAALRTQQPAAVDSGLALDLLAFHTTRLGTAAQHTLAELRTNYAHQVMTLDGLLAACRDLYLLVDPAENRPDAEPSSRLAHDTLAPLVRQRFEKSDARGQRALRILENRTVDWKGDKQGTPLDDFDLALVETGKDGMRIWERDENRLIDASLAAQAQREAERERLHQERMEAEQREQTEREARRRRRRPRRPGAEECWKAAPSRVWVGNCSNCDVDSGSYRRLPIQ